MDDQPAFSSNQPDNDSGLRYPGCGYNVTGLTSSRCPECDTTFVLVKPNVSPSHRSFVLTSSMTCPECGHSNNSFMPQKCAMCGKRFSIWQRVFGVHGQIG